MSLETATAEIRKKRTSLIAAGLQVGEPRGNVEDAGSGGFVQAFSGGVRIYWQRATGVHEVHGPILTKYLALGGPGKKPAHR